MSDFAKPSQNWSICATINEPPYVIKHFITHYVAIGAMHVCLYLDGNDESLSTWIRSLGFSNVTVIEKHQGPAYKLKISHERKQCLNYEHFLKTVCNTDWAGHVDADELVFDPGGYRSFAEYLATIPASVEAVRLMPVEPVLAPEDDPSIPFSASFARTRALPVEKFERDLEDIYGNAAQLLYHGLAGHIKGKTFIRRINTLGKIGLHGVNEPQKHKEFVDWDYGFILLHYDAISFQHWERKWSLRLNGVVRMAGLSDKRSLYLSRFQECSDNHVLKSELYRSVYQLTPRQITKLNRLKMLIPISTDHQSVSRSPQFTHTTTRTVSYLNGVSSLRQPTNLSGNGSYGRFYNVRNDINHRLLGLLHDRRFDEFSALKRDIGRTEFVDKRIKIKPRSGASTNTNGVLFLAGLHRSGTTLLEQLLVSSFHALHISASVPENEGQFLQDVLPTDNSFGGPGLFAFYHQMQGIPPLDEAQAQQERSRILDCWTPWIIGDGGPLIEKSPPNLVRIPYLRRLFKGAKFIIVVRDPRAVSVATKKWNGSPFLLHFLHWCSAHMIALDALDYDCMIVRYEDICENTKDVITSIARFAGLAPRQKPLQLPSRFTTVDNRNHKYIEHFGTLPKIIDRKMFVKPWEIFGYDLSSTFREGQ